MAGKYRRFRKPRYCPNARTGGFRSWKVSEGDLILYREPHTDGTHGYVLARVLGLATHGGDGSEYPKPRLAVLAVDDMLTFGMERHVALEDVEEVLDRGAPARHFARWFLFGQMPPPELAYALVEYGGMSDGYLGEYLTGPEGELRKDWRDVARAQWDRIGRPAEVGDPAE